MWSSQPKRTPIPIKVIQLFTTTITSKNTANTRLNSSRSCLRRTHSCQSKGSSARVESPCRIRIDTSLCRCGVIAAQRLAGINSETAIR